jgi:hypothetical protein
VRHPVQTTRRLLRGLTSLLPMIICVTRECLSCALYRFATRLTIHVYYRISRALVPSLEPPARRLVAFPRKAGIIACVNSRTFAASLANIHLLVTLQTVAVSATQSAQYPVTAALTFLYIALLQKRSNPRAHAAAAASPRQKGLSRRQPPR